MSPREMIDRLIAFPTVSRDSNMALIDFVRDYLDGHGVASTLVPNEDGSKANLYATVGPMVEGGIVLSGHTDVVPVDGQPWSSDPFAVNERGGRLYGRGTADMKSYIALGLAAVPDILAAGVKAPIHFALSYDEEVGCTGASAMITDIVARVPRPRAVLIGEPTSMKVVTAHKGMLGMDVAVRGREAHSSQVHRGVSAVTTSARLIAFLDDMMAEAAAAADPESLFEPPFTTIHTGWVAGGTAQNIIARDCKFTVDIRAMPEDDAHAYVQRFRAYAAELLAPAREIAEEAEIDIVIDHDTPGLAPEPDGEAERIARQLTGDNGVHCVCYGTEAGLFQAHGLSTVVCGPGSIDQAHKPDEYIELSEIAACERYLDKLIARLAS